MTTPITLQTFLATNLAACKPGLRLLLGSHIEDKSPSETLNSLGGSPSAWSAWSGAELEGGPAGGPALREPLLRRDSRSTTAVAKQCPSKATMRSMPPVKVRGGTFRTSNSYYSLHDLTVDERSVQAAVSSSVPAPSDRERPAKRAQSADGGMQRARGPSRPQSRAAPTPARTPRTPRTPTQPPTPTTPRTATRRCPEPLKSPRPASAATRPRPLSVPSKTATAASVDKLATPASPRRSIPTMTASASGVTCPASP